MELQVYINNAFMADKYLLDWWKINQSIYPNLVKLARKLLTIPATSATCERVISTADVLIDKRRTRLSPENVVNKN